MVNEELLNKAVEAKNITINEQSENPLLEKFQKVTGFVHEDHAKILMTGVDADWYIPAGAYLSDEATSVQEATSAQEATSVIDIPTPEEVTAHIGSELPEDLDKYDLDNDKDIDEADVDIAQSELNIQGATGAQGSTGAQGVTGPGE